VSLLASVWLSLVGFYIVKNAIDRDRKTRVGQILATTPISKSFYTLGKALSNFAVLASMVLVLALAAFALHLFHRADPHIDFIALFAPILVLGLSTVAVTAALAVLFESLPVLRGGVGNIFYFFLWTGLLVFGVATMGQQEGSSHHLVNPFTDYTGIVSTMSQMQNQVHDLDAGFNDSASFSVGGLNAPTRTFFWKGLAWTPALLLSRAMLVAIAILLSLLAALFFDRFDPALAGWLAEKNPKPARKGAAPEPAEAVDLPQPQLSAAQLTPLLRTGAVRTRFLALVAAEFRLLSRGHAWWWYTVAAGLFIGCLAAPLEMARSGLILAAWLWPALIWSQLGTREAQYSTGALIFSAPHAAPRQLLATYAAGVLVAVLTGGGLGLHLLMAENFAGLGAWAAGAAFVPALALVLGVVTGSRKFFEALYTAWWYVGPMHHIRGADFMGTTAASSTPGAYLSAAAVLVGVAYSWRMVRLAQA